MGLLAIIPARGGSKGIPRKNLRLIGDKPLICWTIECAKAASSVERVIVTTDDEEIAQTALKSGAEVPFMRPASLAQDDTSGVDPIWHALDWLEKNEGYRPQHAVMLQPTSPLRTAQDIEMAYRIALAKDPGAVIGVSESTQHPHWTKRIDDEGCLIDFVDQYKAVSRRQDLPAAYIVNGAIYMFSRMEFLREKSWFRPKAYPYVMPHERSLDIDSLWDFYVTDLIVSAEKSRDAGPYVLNLSS